jgi:hypothetical protein
MLAVKNSQKRREIFGSEEQYRQPGGDARQLTGSLEGDNLSGHGAQIIV